MRKKDLEEFEEEEDEVEEEDEEEELDIVTLIEQNIRQLMTERSNYPSTSETYMILTMRISEATEQLRNAEEARNERAQRDCAIRNRNTALYQTLGTVAGNIAGSTIGALINRSNVKTVVGYEGEGGIVNSKALKFVK